MYHEDMDDHARRHAVEVVVHSTCKFHVQVPYQHISRRVCESPAKQCDIFLSHSGHEKSFVEQLYQDLKNMNQHAFFDQDSDCLLKAEKFAPVILKAAARCRVGVVVVSERYLTSKSPMLELSKFVECKVKLFPLFFKLSPGDLKGTEVETRWKESWRRLVETGEVKEEVLELWSKAVKELRSSNGLEYGKFSGSEYKYRAAIVDEICKRWPRKSEWSTCDIQGCDRLCKVASSMFKGGDQGDHEYLGLHGMGGVGKSTLCKAMCSFFQGEFGGRVCYVELPSDQSSTCNGTVARLKHVVQRLARFVKSVSDSISTEEEGWKLLEDGLRDQPPVFMAIDNVGDFEASREEACNYVRRLPSGSKVLVTARSREILKHVLGEEKYCEPIPRLEWLEAATLFLSKAAPKRSVSSLVPKEREVVEKCLSECKFDDKGYGTKQYHPLVLRALGTYFHDVDSGNVMSWQGALEDKNKLIVGREARNVNGVLRLNDDSLPDQKKLIFLDCVIYYNYGYPGFWFDRPWWTPAGDQDELNKWVSWISEVHGVSPSEAKMMVKELQRLSLLEESNVEVSIHDLYKEFARTLVEKEGSKEWQWWMSRLGNDVTQFKRLVLKYNKSIIGRTPRRFLEWQDLVFLELCDCGDIGPDLELGGFSSLRVLHVDSCDNLKRIACSCNNGYNDGECCYNRKPSLGCMTELVTVKLFGLKSLESLPILRHCPCLKHLEVHLWSEYTGLGGPMLHADSGMFGLVDFRYLTALRVFSILLEDLETLVDDCDEFIRWLLSGLQLENLTVFQFQDPQFCESPRSENDVGSFTVDLNEAAHLSPRLSVLAVTLPEQIEVVKGLHLMSELRTLSLANSRGLRQLPDLRCMPKLEQICVSGCCKLEALPLLRPGIQGFDHCWWNEYENHECLQPYCISNSEDELCSECKKRTNTDSCLEDELCSECKMRTNTDSCSEDEEEDEDEEFANEVFHL